MGGVDWVFCPALLNPQAPEETNVLTDGCLIDLCGVTLMWRTAIGLEQGPVSLSLNFLEV